jgi:hypothetical protein
MFKDIVEAVEIACGTAFVCWLVLLVAHGRIFS